jgi:hypothetical protein
VDLEVSRFRALQGAATSQDPALLVLHRGPTVFVGPLQLPAQVMMPQWSNKMNMRYTSLFCDDLLCFAVI